MSPNLLAILPEVLLTITGIVIMLAEPVVAPGKSRKPLGALAVVGAIAAGAASFYQLHIVDIPPAAADEARVLEARNRLTKREFTHPYPRLSWPRTNL